MKKFSVPCNFGGQMSNVDIYIGNPENKHHPIHFQAEWLAKERGGNIPNDVMEALAEIKELADKNGVPFEDLCTYALLTSTNDSTESN